MKTKAKNKKEKKVNKPVRDPRHRKFRVLSTSLTIIVIVAIVLLNVIVGFLADRFPLTLDMSSEKVFTLSDESKEIVQSMTKDVEIVIFADINAYFNSIAEQVYQYYYYNSGIEVNLSNELNRVGREVETALTQLNTASDDRITYTIIVPDQEPQKYAEYNTKYNLGSNNVLFISGERHRKIELSTMCDYFSSYTSVTSNVEKVLLSNIYALQGDSDRIVQVLIGHDENSGTIQGLKKLYELNGYQFENLQITGAAEFNKNAEMLLIAAPSVDYTEDEVQRILDWVRNDNKRNRHLMVFINPLADCPNLYEMLKTHFHIEVTDQLIYEDDEGRIHREGDTFNFGIITADVPEGKYTKNSAGSLAVKLPIVRRLICDLPATSDYNTELGIPLTTHPNTAWVSDKSGEKVTLKTDEYPLTSSVTYVNDSWDSFSQKAASTTVTVFGCAEMAFEPHIANHLYKNEELLLDVPNGIFGNEFDLGISTKVIDQGVINITPDTAIVVGVWIFTVSIPVVVLVICLIVFLRRRSL